MVGLAKDVDFRLEQKKHVAPLCFNQAAYIFMTATKKYISTFNFHHISMTLRDPIYTPYHRMMERGSRIFLLISSKASLFTSETTSPIASASWWCGVLDKVTRGTGGGWVGIHGVVFFFGRSGWLLVVGCFFGGGWGFNFAERDSIPIFLDSFCMSLFVVVVGCYL